MVRPQRSRVWCSGIVALAIAALLPESAMAQLTPDSSLGAEQSIVVPGTVNGLPADLIQGGAQRGSLLFHSFRDFNVSEGGRTYFGNPTEVENVFMRVTGTTASNIFGTLGVNGGANLFLLNPNGMVFGANARLDMRGSFVATSADRLIFSNGFAFSASNPQAPPLLTISVPIGLQYGSRPSSIQTQGATLQAALGQTLALLGGTVSINGGRILAPQGRVELGGVAADGNVGLNIDGSDLSARFPDTTNRADISVGKGAEINVRNNDRGTIVMNARNITFTEASRVRAGIPIGLGTSQSQAGNIELNATGAVQATGGSIIANNTGGQGNAGAVIVNAQDFVSFDDESEIQSAIGQVATGNSGGITINTGSLYLANGAALNSINLQGQGNAGDIIINARDTVVLDSPETPQASGSSTSFIRSSVQNGKGNGGNINITTGSLLLKNGSTLFSGLRGGNADGNAGSININARDRVSIDGANRPDQTSGIRSNVFAGKGNSGNINIVTGSLFVSNGGVLNTNIQSSEGEAAGNININARDTVSFEGASRDGVASKVLSNAVLGAINSGNITITTKSFSVSNGAVLTTSTLGQGNGGNITVNTDTTDVTNGGQLYTTTFDAGRAGNITVNATSGVSLSGSDLTYFKRLSQLSTNDVGLSPMSGMFASTSEASTGSGGELVIHTPQLKIQDGAELVVSSSGVGQAGSLFVTADRIVLNTQGSIRADTSGGGGSINLQSPLVLLRGGSNITTNAIGNNIPGGDIQIDTRFLVAVPNEDSNISANSQDFRGGNVRINATSIYGIQPRSTPTSLSSITATGATTALSGTIDISTLGLDPTSGLLQLPTDVVDSSGLIATVCPADRGNSFSISGRGGLPEDPRQPLMGQGVWLDDRSPKQAQSVDQTSPSVSSIMEAQGWIRDRAGRVVLVAARPSEMLQPMPSLCSLLTGSH